MYDLAEPTSDRREPQVAHAAPWSRRHRSAMSWQLDSGDVIPRNCSGEIDIRFSPDGASTAEVYSWSGWTSAHHRGAEFLSRQYRVLVWTGDSVPTPSGASPVQTESIYRAGLHWRICRKPTYARGVQIACYPSNIAMIIVVRG